MNRGHQGASAPLGGDSHYLVTDRHGTQHDVGSLVSAVLSLHRHHPVEVESAIDLDEGDRQLVRAPAEAALEAGIRLSVLKLFGPEASRAFSMHCDALKAAGGGGMAPVARDHGN